MEQFPIETDESRPRCREVPGLSSPSPSPKKKQKIYNVKDSGKGRTNVPRVVGSALVETTQNQPKKGNKSL